MTSDAEAAKRPAKVQVSGMININEASAAQLDLLPGVSPKSAQAIVAYRTEHRFTRPEEIVKVRGFGKKRFERIKGFLEVEGPTTIKRTKPLRTPKAPAKPVVSAAPAQSSRG